MENIIVSGGTGFLGRNLIRRLLAEGYAVYAIVRPNSRNIDQLPKHANLHPVVCELTDLEKNLTAFPATCDAFYHFAWGGVNRADMDNDEIHRTSMEQSLICVHTAIRLGCRCFVDAGSRTEYGNPRGVFREDLECHPLVAYGRAKLEFGRQAHSLCDGTATRFIHARIFSVYGADDHPWSLIYTCVTKMLRNESIDLSPCTHFWNFMDVRDTADLLLTFYQKADRIPAGDNGIFNVATQDTRPLRDFVEEIKIITGSQSELRFGAFQPGTESAMSILPDMTKVVRTFDWKEKIDFNAGIQNMIDKMERTT